MLKKTIEFEDLFEGGFTKEDFYFHMNKAELMELEMSTPGGFEAKIQKVIDAEDKPGLIAAFKEIVLLAYGERDGSKFVKSEAARQEFASSEAYSALFMELATDDKAATEFINGVMPKENKPAGAKPRTRPAAKK